MNKKTYLVVLALLLVACNLPGVVSPTSSPTPSPAPEPSPTASNLPGLVIRGRVTANGAGLAGVSIYKRFSAYPYSLIAITDEYGYYESEFITIPGDEMVSVEAELSGYAFDPPYHYWRHYHGYEITNLDFAATALP